MQPARQVLALAPVLRLFLPAARAGHDDGSAAACDLSVPARRRAVCPTRGVAR
jgi:hypothetical protein